jgi:hypothetical protein
LIEVKAVLRTCVLLHQRKGASRPINSEHFPLTSGRMLLSGLLEGICSPFLPSNHTVKSQMRIYYFDMKDGIPTRDRKGIEFPSAAAAIAHSKELARRLRDEPRLKDPALAIVVIDESGTEVHREPVHPGAANPGMSTRKIENFNRID